MELPGEINAVVLIRVHAGTGLREYADTIPIHRLQFPHNKSAIVLVDVQTLTPHIERVEITRRSFVGTQVKHYINGRQVAGRNGRTSSVFNPATGEQTGLVPIANAADVADAVAAATKAAPGWAATTPLRRARILNRFLRILEERTSELADIIVADHGKVHSDAVAEIHRGIKVL